MVCDPTGQLEIFVKKHLLSNLGGEDISGADIFANEKMTMVLNSKRSAILTDVNSMQK